MRDVGQGEVERRGAGRLQNPDSPGGSGDFRALSADDDLARIRFDAWWPGIVPH